jgi:hypothetical protein
VIGIYSKRRRRRRMRSEGENKQGDSLPYKDYGLPTHKYVFHNMIHIYIKTLTCGSNHGKKAMFREGRLFHTLRVPSVEHVTSASPTHATPVTVLRWAATVCTRKSSSPTDFMLPGSYVQILTCCFELRGQGAERGTAER